METSPSSSSEYKTILQRTKESPPAGNRKRRTARGITCPSITYPLGGGTPSQLSGGGGGECYPILTWPGEIPQPDLAGGYPIPAGGYPIPARGYPIPAGEYPNLTWLGGRGGTPRVWTDTHL